MTRLVRACAATCAAIVGMAFFASAAEALPAKFWGVVAQASPTAEQLQRLHRGGVQSIRIPFEWASVQPVAGGALNWSGVDVAVGHAVAAGIDVLPFLNGAPTWAVPAAPVPGTGGAARAPVRLPATGAAATAWKAFLRGAVERYGPGGAFWAANPSLPERPIRAWQIWNEENFKYFVARPNPAEYGNLVKISSPAIKSVDPGAKVVLGGLFARPIEATQGFKPPRAYFATDFLEQMYEKTPGVKAKFNGIGLHPYTYRYQSLTPDIEAVREVLKANHDPGKGIWITELGWSSSSPDAGDGFAKGPKGQVTQLKGAFSLLKRNQAKWKVQRVYWFSVDDKPGACNFCDGSGLFSAGFKPKKSWFEYVRFAGGTP